ncbi:MAG: DUF3090 family protein, partial [Actinomycetota bacterium]
MSASFDIDPVDHITASAVGEPGDRTFFVHAEGGMDTVTLLAEKEQVRLLAEAVLQLLGSLPDADEGPEPPEDELELAEPIEPEWRVGEIAIEFEEQSGSIEITITEALPEDDPGLPARARLGASRAQARAMATHALEIVAAGRPRCQFCGFPLD